MTSIISTPPSASSMFDSVVWSKQRGQLNLTKHGILFVPTTTNGDTNSDDEDGALWEWDAIRSCKCNAASSTVHKVKLELMEDKPVILSMRDRSQAEQLCKAVEQMLQASAMTDINLNEAASTEHEPMLLQPEQKGKRASSLYGESNDDKSSSSRSVTSSTRGTSPPTGMMIQDPLMSQSIQKTTGSQFPANQHRQTAAVRGSHHSKNQSLPSTKTPNTSSHATSIPSQANYHQPKEETFQDEPDPEMADRYNKSYPPPTSSHPTKRKKRFWQSSRFWILIVVVLLLIAILGVAIGNLQQKDDNEKSSSAVVGLQQTTLAPQQPTQANNQETESSNNQEICPYDITETGSRSDIFLSTGCFQDASSMETHQTTCDTPDLQAMECSRRCFTRLFGVTHNNGGGGGVCKCFSQVPSARIGIGSCTSYDDDVAVATTKKVNGQNNRKLNNTSDATTGSSSSMMMELYINLQTNQECKSPITESVRDFLVQEDNAPFGFDIVANTFRTSPFQLLNDECGTNIYEVYTDVSEDRFSFQTIAQDVMSFAQERRSDVQSAIAGSVSGSAGNAFVQASVRVSASYDRDQTNILQSSGANEVGSKVFKSTGVKRVARVEIPDFDKRSNIVTFSSTFARRLKDYLEGGFQQATAFEIFDIYGQFVLTRGMFGGYMELRSTMSATSLRSFESEESALSECYEVAVSAEVKAAGFGASGSVSGSLETGVCTDEEMSAMQEAQSEYQDETNEQNVFGGKISCSNEEDVTSCNFEVEPSVSRLLTTKDKYPTGDVGIQFRPLSDFLNPEKISPLEVKRWHITEEQFGQIQENLAIHTLEYLNQVEEKLDVCNCTNDQELVYLVDDPNEPGGSRCQCYSPVLPTLAPTLAPTLPNCNGINHEEVINDINNPTDAGAHSGDTWCKNRGFRVACYENYSWKQFQEYSRTQGEWFKARITERSDCTAPIRHRIQLTVPEDVNYDLFVFKDDTSNPYKQSIQTFGRTEEIIIEEADVVGTQTVDYYVLVQHVGGASCTPWTLTFYHHPC